MNTKLLSRFCVASAVVLALATCSVSPPESVSLKFTIGGFAKGRGVSSVTGFSCFGLLVTGDKIRPKEEFAAAGYVPASYCSYAGLGSSFVPLQAGGTNIELVVPSLSPLLIQVVALDTTAGCPTGTVAAFLADAKTDGADAGVRGLYEVGSYRISGGLTSDKDISISNTYDSNAPLDILSCSSSTSLRVTPSGLVGIDSGGKIALQAAGGSGSYEYSVSGGGTITSDGLFTAPSGTGQTSYVTVKDAANHKIRATTAFRNFSSATTPLFWYTANSYTTVPPRNLLTTSAPDYWINQGSRASADLHPIIPVGGSTHTYVPSELNGFPALELRNKASLHISGLSGDVVDGVHSFVVAKVLSTSLGSIFCFSGSSTCTSSDSSTSLEVFPGAIATWRAQATGYTNVITSSATSVTTSYSLAETYGSLPTSGSSTIQLKLDQQTPAQGTTAGSLGFTTSSGYFLVGLENSGGSVDANIAEIIVYSAPLGAVEAASVKAYLQAKYRL